MISPRRTLALTAAATTSIVVGGCAEQSGQDPSTGSTATTASSPVTGSPGESASSEPSDSPSTAASADPSAPSSSEPSPSSDPAPEGAVVPPAQRPDDPAAGPVHLAVVGDLKLAHRAAGDITAGRGSRVFAGVADELASADLTLGNLETTLGTARDQGDRQHKRYTFMSPPSSPEVLLDAGFDHVSLANNHVYDFGEPGILSTVRALDQAGLPNSGAGADPRAAREPAVLEANGRRIAVLSYMDVPADNARIFFSNKQWEATSQRAGVAWGHPEQVAQDVAAVRDQVDDVLVVMHAGRENKTFLVEEQRAIAQAALDAGATAVLGHHAHVLQGYRQDPQDGTAVAWGLGNFVFDGYPEGAEQTDSAILHLTLDDQGVTDLSFTPVALRGGYPVALDETSGRGRAILDRLERLEK